jgi:AraC-like DNA-binding protein
MIATYVTKPLPVLVEAAAGTRAIGRILSAADVPNIAQSASGGFMPQRNLYALLESSARVLGMHDLGLAYGRHLDVADWGIWGSYVRGAQTLEAALRRAGRAMPYHVSMDTLTLEVRGDQAWFIHRAELFGLIGYPHYAACAVAAMISLVKAFTGPVWRPARIEINLPRPRPSQAWEDVFRCPVVFDRPDLAVILPRELLTTTRLSPPVGRPVTTTDLRRLVSAGPPRDFLGEVTEIVRSCLLQGECDIEELARILAIGPRTLQRRLADAGTSYRDIVARIRVERALELLQETDIPILDISDELGYSAPTHFARAFRRVMGRSPDETRRASNSSIRAVSPQNI